MTSIIFTEEEKDRLVTILRREILELENVLSNHETTVQVNKLQHQPKLDNEAKEEERKQLIDLHERAVTFLTKEVETLETIRNKLLNNNNA